MQTSQRLYLSRLINSFGSWLTFIAIALLLQEKYGSRMVAFSFLVQSLPALFFSRYFARLIPSRLSYRVYIFGHILLAVNVFALLLSSQLWAIYLYLLIASTLNSVLTPLSNTLVGQWVEREDLSHVQTRLGAITAAVLTLAPPLGASISSFMGYHFLFVIDAVSFVVAAIILCPQPAVVSKYVSATPSNSFTEKLEEKQLPQSSALNAALKSWYWYLCVGAVLNGIEFAVFAKHSFSKQEIGWILGCWGLGNLVAFVLARKLKNFYNARSYIVAFVYGLALLQFVVVSSFYSAMIAFVAAGFTYALLGGSLRAKIQHSIPSTTSAQFVWAVVNERLSIINITLYGLVGWLLGYVSPFALGVFLFCVTMGLVYDLRGLSRTTNEK